MRLSRAGVLLLAANVVNASSYGSPFFLVSSDPLPPNSTLHSTQLAKSLDVEDRLVESLADCTARRYTVVSQNGVSEQDFRGSKAFARTRKTLARAKSGAYVEIPNVGIHWYMDGEKVRSRLSEACEGKGRTVINEEDLRKADEVVIEHVTMEDLPVDDKKRAKVVAATDLLLDKKINDVIAASSQESRVLIYLTTGEAQTAHDQQSYEMDEPLSSSAMHMDLKRDLYARQDDSSNEWQAGLPLFERYQFLTPALFMGFAVSLLLLIILYVGISAIAGLEVSYSAFSKEMGPQAQKKQQ